MLPAASYAQDEALLKCADLVERETRLNCLEAALETAVRNRDAATAREKSSAASSSTSQGSAPSTSALSSASAAQSAPQKDPAANEPRDLNLFGWLNREDEKAEQEPVETLHAKIVQLELFKPDIWTITLDNGQVWRQNIARRFNLRADDVIQIYNTRWGKQYRLEAERFNGYIQVERIR
ncbi:MAG: hypothetical protein V4628_00155 [Pseudomonadota bacterium]